MKENQEDTELQDILIDVDNTKINKNEEEENDNILLSSKIYINDFISKEESDIITADISLLKEIGYDQKVINKVYIFLSPPNIETAIDIMTPIKGIYHHDFYENIYQSKKNNKNLCFICNQPKNRHINSTPDGSDEIFNNNIINENNKNIIQKYSLKDNNMCIVCYEEVEKNQNKFNSLSCGHLCCNQCWINYLKTKITEAKVENIKCVGCKCNQKTKITEAKVENIKCVGCKCNQLLSEEFILNYIKQDNILLNKYEKFKLRADILNDPNKRQCPEKNCDKYLKMSKHKFVKCENGHKYCFECLRPWHEDESCEKSLEKDFLNWKKNKNLKRCPKCKIYTEKNEGCNHMTCSNCKFEWCWLCEEQYMYGHYNQGKCKGFQFSRANNFEEANRISNNANIEHQLERCRNIICEAIVRTIIKTLLIMLCEFLLKSK